MRILLISASAVLAGRLFTLSLNAEIIEIMMD